MSWQAATSIRSLERFKMLIIPSWPAKTSPPQFFNTKKWRKKNFESCFTGPDFKHCSFWTPQSYIRNHSMRTKSCEDARDKDDWRLGIKGATTNTGWPGKWSMMWSNLPVQSSLCLSVCICYHCVRVVLHWATWNFDGAEDARVTGVQNSVKMSDISLLKSEPNWPQNSKTENSSFRSSVFKSRLRWFGDSFSRCLTHSLSSNMVVQH